MPIDPSSLFQGVSAIVNLALWIAKAENAPKEVSRCLELVQLVYKDTQYLIELRNETLSTLEQTPRELARIDDVIITSTRSIQDIGGFLEKYRPAAHNGRTSVRSRIVWVLSDSETFSLRAPNLLVQHNTVLGEIQTLRTFQMIGPLLKATREREIEIEKLDGPRKFENINLLHSLMGNDSKRPQLQVSSSTTEFTPPPISACSRAPTFDIMGQSFNNSVSGGHWSSLRHQHQPSLVSLFTPPPPYSPPDASSGESCADFFANTESTTSSTYPSVVAAVPSREAVSSTQHISEYRLQDSYDSAQDSTGLKALMMRNWYPAHHTINPSS
ncbi:hypothetical protein BD289DRAFT_12680 [Coniella lustricola]|uniref:Uncharacterized protein n=1 Tax=Coniella lustricola TaxID=2025994 RepID=A0A2T3A4C1_9PEZI|nr:hypothetical protein BD289DRAFT_12680 [Coniella lustricola]